MDRSSRSAPLTLVACTALLLSATGGAVATAMITGADIKNGTITTADVKNRNLAANDLSPGAVASLQGTSGPAGAAGPAGPAGGTGPAGAPGLVRAYGHVSGTTTVDRQSGGITVTTPEVGYRCLSVPGVDPTTTSPVATIDWIGGSTFGTTQTFVEVNTTNCPVGTLGVRTFTRDFSGSGDLVASNEAFFILIP